MPQHIDRFAERRHKLLGLLADHTTPTGTSTPLPPLLVTSEANVTYLTGFTGDSTWLIIGPQLTVLISDSRYTTQLAEECPSLEVSIRKADTTINDELAKVVRKARLSRIAFESHVVTVDSHKTCSTKLPAVEFVPTSGLVEKLRAVKDYVELADINAAVSYAERAFAGLLPLLTPDMTELQVAHELEHLMRRLGAERAAFPVIIAAGPRSALPHARPGLTPIRDSQLLLFDWGAETHSKYRCDITRTTILGKPSTKVLRVYEVVLEAQRRAIDAIRPGARCKDIDTIARKFIADQGFGKKFGHGLGHSFGLTIHESPRFSPLSNEVLQPNMLLTVEPGIYLPGWGGIRIEDDVLVTEDGCEVITTLPRDLDHMIMNI